MLDNLFEINDISNIQVEEFQGSKIYTMDNFYKYPEAILNHLLYNKVPELWKGNETSSYNGQHFFDLRHRFDNNGFKKVGTVLATLCNQTSPTLQTVRTNCFKLVDKEFNDYKNNFWGPHKDVGYTALIYFNNILTYTNIYEQLEDDIWTGPEHYEPWRSRKKYKIIKQLEGKFNRLIMFDGNKFLHGMDISTDEFFNSFRINQVLFLKEFRM